MLRPFALHRPATADAACELLARYGDDALPYAGGTELLLVMKLGLTRPGHLVDVKRLPAFDAIRLDGDRLVIGAAVTHRALERSALVHERLPLLASVARHVANVRVRNVGTVGGNLAFADPHSDLATVLLALDASVELVSPRGRREVALAEFVRGPYETARAPDELLAAVRLTPWPAGTAAAYVKFGVHERPTLGVAVALLGDGASPATGVAADARRPSTPVASGTAGGASVRIRQARVAVGCVTPRPERMAAAEARLAGAALADLRDAGREVARLVAERVEPVDDLHGSAEYKREMAAVFTGRALAAAAARAHGAEPAARYPYAVLA